MTITCHTCKTGPGRAGKYKRRMCVSVCVCVCVVCVRLQGTTHTHPCLLLNSLLLLHPQLHYNEAEVMTQAHHLLLSTHSLPLLTPLVTTWSTVGGSAALQTLFDPFHIRLNCRDPISQLGTLWKLPMLGFYQPNGQNHNSSHSKYPGCKHRAGFGSPVGNRSSSFTVVQPPRRTVWHPETPHAEGTQMSTTRQIHLRDLSELQQQKLTLICVKSAEGLTTFTQTLMSPSALRERISRLFKVNSSLFWACLSMSLLSKTRLRCTLINTLSQIKKKTSLLKFHTSQGWF